VDHMRENIGEDTPRRNSGGKEDREVEIGEDMVEDMENRETEKGQDTEGDIVEDTEEDIGEDTEEDTEETWNAERLTQGKTRKRT
jgi:hypothetical protein